MTDLSVRPVPAPARSGKATHLLEVRDLFVEIPTRDGVAKVLNGVSYHLDGGETLAILGESDSGKSVTARAIMGILDRPALIRSGQIFYQGRDLLALPEEQRRQIRGKEIAMIFQDAPSALNPVFPVGWQIGETLRRRKGLSRADARKRVIELMSLVKIPAAAQRAGDYPHQFSGGMRQRVMIAMALAMEPKILVADEPVTTLDVTVQARITDLLAELRRDLNMAMIVISHDLGVVARVADRIAVMYAGRIVEHADVHGLYAAPAHPYTKGLLQSIPRVDQRGQVLATIKGLPPDPTRIPTGCPFHPRCPCVEKVCVDVVPSNLMLGDGRTSACHFAQEVRDGRIGP
jgi:oligopeptide/dipeptide ABC transporter ATP-binding protein